METEVLIIGGGPAGLTAAFEMASRGLEVTIIDESFSLGGQLCQQTQLIRALPSAYQPMAGFKLANKLTEQLKDFSVRYLLGHRVIGLYADGSIGVTDEKDVFPVKAKKILVATGAAENAISFPKWTLPGVITIGAAQTLVNRDFVMPGKEALIVGSSDFALDVAYQLMEVGVNIKGIIEKSAVVNARDKEKVNQVEKKGIPFYFNSYVKEAKGNGEVEAIDIQLQNGILTETVDLVCIDGSRSPILDSFYQLGCSFGYQEVLGGWIPQYNKHFQTDQKNVFLAGNAAGISNHAALLLTGMISGISICEELKVLNRDAFKELTLSYWRELENLENKDAWQARIRHIEKFSAPLLKDQFIS
ncbi:NAD(P)/FAD-dependent oxidoreductase [Mesobacillus harenae]|uniref:NAD(P)/FAD-dependent oxidoreductase n=1 Tax=Mesobacillus harenae TaxID=2213203 RepID=UPI001580DFB3|nr:FAD-dependent oxidoreductase [Mesobacillus harenae]